jgi:hypothetical protein
MHFTFYEITDSNHDKAEKNDNFVVQQEKTAGK